MDEVEKSALRDGIANAGDQFKHLLGKAARTFAEAEFFNGNPADWSHSFEDYHMNAATKARFDDAKQAALIELVMFAKVRGDDVIAQAIEARRAIAADDVAAPPSDTPGSGV